VKAITAYVCDFCPKRRPFKSKSSGSRHEKNCYRNPETRSCATCKHFAQEDAEPEVGFFGCVGCDVDAPGFYTPHQGEPVETRLQTRCTMWEPKEATA
jgi:hypothetical protein